MSDNRLYYGNNTYVIEEIAAVIGDRNVTKTTGAVFLRLVDQLVCVTFDATVVRRNRTTSKKLAFRSRVHRIASLPTSS